MLALARSRASLSIRTANAPHYHPIAATGLTPATRITPRRLLPLALSPIKQFATVVDNLPPLTRDLYWQKIARWDSITESQFKSYAWQTANTIETNDRLWEFLEEVIPATLAPSRNPLLRHIRTREDFIADAKAGLGKAPMAVRLTPHICSVIDWSRALDDPIRLQFLPLKSGFVEDHPSLKFDSLNERDDSAVQGLVHRYPDKALFLATSVCPVYCRFCTRSYAVGAHTDTVSKEHQKPSRRRWQAIYDYINKTPAITDIVVSGGDTYYLQPEHVKEIGETLLDIKHIRRVRFASKGLAVVPSRTIDPEDSWTNAFIELSNRGRRQGKHVCLHTHFNHPNEITWITRAAARHLFENSVIVRNQTVLLKGVNDDATTMGTLIRSLADMNIQPYYVYQCDLVKGIEDLRTPLRTILDIEQQLRGTIAGFMMPSFVVDLPGGGGKRLATAHETYDRSTGISTFRAPGLSGEKGQRIYQYHDPKPAHAVVEATKPAHIEVGEPKRRPRFVPADASFKGFITRQEMSGRAMAMSPRC